MSPHACKGGLGAKQLKAVRATATAAARLGSQACTMVAAMWPLMEQELHATLKELIRLHGLAEQQSHAKMYKALFRLALPP